MAATETQAADPAKLLVWAGVLGALLLLGLAVRCVLPARPILFGTRTDRPLMFGPLDVVAVLILLVFVGGLAVPMGAYAAGLGEQPTGEGDLDGVIEVSTILLSQALAQVPVAIYFLLRMLNSADRTALRRVPWRELAGIVLRAAAWGAVMFAVILVFSNFCIELGALFGAPYPESGHPMLDILRRTGLRHVAAAIVLSAILFAPVLEETIYRGIVQSSFASITGQWRVAAVVMTSLLFTAFHATVIPWQMLAGIFLLSLILGWLYERSGNLLAPILAHAVFNALNLLVQFHVG